MRRAVLLIWVILLGIPQVGHAISTEEYSAELEKIMMYPCDASLNALEPLKALEICGKNPNDGSWTKVANEKSKVWGACIDRVNKAEKTRAKYNTWLSSCKPGALLNKKPWKKPISNIETAAKPTNPASTPRPNESCSSKHEKCTGNCAIDVGKEDPGYDACIKECPPCN